MRQTICFVRHGETVANEQNIFAGAWDAPLSELGISQAVEAGNHIIAKGLVFDQLHVSTLSRAKITAQLALTTAGQADIPVFENQALAERDFGDCTKKNKNLLRKSYGYKNFEELLHSPFGAPAQAEDFSEMYQRVHDYYHKVLVPEAEAGVRNIVVCHKYIIEMFALVIGGYGPEDYFDFRLPNATPMTEEELCSYIKKESKILKEIGDRTIYHSASLIVGAAVIGVAGKAFFQNEIPPHLFMPLTCLFLAVSSFFATMAVNAVSILKGIDLKKSSPFPWVMKIAVVGAMCLWFGKEQEKADMLMIFLMPPALTVPALSLLWGGSLKTAVSKTFFISLLLPFYLGIIFMLQGHAESARLFTFMMILLVGFMLPAIASQVIRVKSPIASAKFAERWKWLGIAAIVMLAGVITYHFTPKNLVAMVLGDAKEFNLFMMKGLEMGAVFLLIKVSAYMAASCGKKKMSEFIDEYITHSTPNLFLWISCVTWSGQSSYLAFWAALLFFFGIFFDERFFVHLFKTTSKQGWQQKVWLPMPQFGDVALFFSPRRFSGSSLNQVVALERNIVRSEGSLLY